MENTEKDTSEGGKSSKALETSEGNSRGSRPPYSMAEVVKDSIQEPTIEATNSENPLKEPGAMSHKRKLSEGIETDEKVIRKNNSAISTQEGLQDLDAQPQTLGPLPSDVVVEPHLGLSKHTAPAPSCCSSDGSDSLLGADALSIHDNNQAFELVVDLSCYFKEDKIMDGVAKKRNVKKKGKERCVSMGGAPGKKKLN